MNKINQCWQRGGGGGGAAKNSVKITSFVIKRCMFDIIIQDCKVRCCKEL